MKTRIRFDLSRIFQRGTRLTPTGIDRVDIRYAQMFIRNTDLFEFEGVFIQKGFFVLVSNSLAIKICDLVYKKWIDGVGPGYFHIEQIEECIRDLAEEVRKTSLHQNSKIDVRLIKNTTPQHSIYINTGFSGLDSTIDHGEYKKATGDKMVYFVHDLLPLEYPEYFWKDWGKVHLQRLMNSCSVADLIVTVSEDVALKLRNLLQHLNIDFNHIAPIRNGVEDKFVDNSMYSNEICQPKNQFTIVSTIEPRKNHLMLLEIWREFVFAGLENIPKLVIIGDRGWHNTNTFEFIDKCTAIHPYIEEVSDVGDDAMINYIRESKATLFPTYGEGWGLPVVESMALGVQVICSDLSVLRECSDNMAEYIEIHDKRKWIAEILRFSRMGVEACLGVQAKLSHFKPTRWEESFLKLIQHIEKLR